MKTISQILFFLFCAFGTNAQVVINEVYGGGGNNGAPVKNDFIELYNNGSTDVSLAGWSVQYASAAGTSWATTALTGTIKAGGYFLIQEAAGSGNVAALPAPDVIGTISMSGTAGKVALSNSITALSGACPLSVPDPNIVDFVGFGSTASCSEGTGPTTAPSNANSVQRIFDAGTKMALDNNDNKNDFTAGPPSPNNSSIAPLVLSFSPADNATDIATAFTANITFDKDVAIGASGSILVKLTSNNSTIQTIDLSSITISGTTASFLVSGLGFNTSYYFTIDAGTFKDLAGNDFGGISDNSTWNFNTVAASMAGIVDHTYDLEQCTGSIPDGFSQFSVLGSATWTCSNFGRDATDPTKDAGHGVQMNGFTGGSNQVNNDWLISPSFDLSATNYPLLSFWSRTAFNGDQIKVKVSTDYPGTGDPSAYTWTDLNGHLPATGSNVWTLSENINLTGFKSANTYFAFEYTSTADDGARWTLDDIRIDNSSTAPAPTLTAIPDELQFGYVATQTTAVKDFTFTANDIIANVSLSAGSGYLISKTNSNFTTSIAYTLAEANNTPQKVFVQFKPSSNNASYDNNVLISTAGVTNKNVKVSGNSISPDITLEVVNWNLEWFGTSVPGFGPPDKDLQASNVKKMAVNIGADLYSFVEVVSEPRLQSVVDTLNKVFGAGTYAYVLCDYGSHTNPFETGHGSLNDAQKEAFVYKTSVISVLSTSPLVTDGVNTAADLSNPAYNYFSSGRYPYMMEANVTLGGVTKMVRFVLLHAKANTKPFDEAYERRKNGADTLNYTLNKLYPDDRIVLLGDFNDDLDFSVAQGYTVSSYDVFNADAADFYSPTLVLSLAGKKSTVGFNDMIDHVELSNEMEPYYMQNTAAVLTDVAALIPNYGTTTTDHYPIFTRYAFNSKVLPVVLVSFTANKRNNAVVLDWATSQEVNSKSFVVEKSADLKFWTDLDAINAKGNSTNGNTYSTTDFAPYAGMNYYRLKEIDQDGAIQYSLIRSVAFDAVKMFKIVPNPATSTVTIEFSKSNAGLTNIEVYDLGGKLIHQESTSDNNARLNVSNFRKGTYIIKIKQGNEINNEKLIVQ